jgi:hypothetical protein
MESCLPVLIVAFSARGAGLCRQAWQAPATRWWRTVWHDIPIPIYVKPLNRIRDLALAQRQP